MRQPTRKIARLAWELLIRRMTDGPGEPERIELQAAIELRESVGPSPDAIVTPADMELDRQGPRPSRERTRRRIQTPIA